MSSHFVGVIWTAEFKEKKQKKTAYKYQAESAVHESLNHRSWHCSPTLPGQCCYSFIYNVNRFSKISATVKKKKKNIAKVTGSGSFHGCICSQSTFTPLCSHVAHVCVSDEPVCQAVCEIRSEVNPLLKMHLIFFAFHFIHLHHPVFAVLGRKSKKHSDQNACPGG